MPNPILALNGEELRLTMNRIKKQQIKLFGEKKSVAQNPKAGSRLLISEFQITRYL